MLRLEKILISKRLFSTHSFVSHKDGHLFSVVVVVAVVLVVVPVVVVAMASNSFYSYDCFVASQKNAYLSK